MMSPAGHEHGRIAMRLGRFLAAHVDENDLGAVYAAETGFILGRDPDTVRAPDVAFVRKGRLETANPGGFFPGPPDLAVEVLSPGDSASDVLDKVNDWLNAGTNEVWIVDMKRRSITVSSRQQPVRAFHENADLTCEKLLPGFRLSLASVFR